MGPCPKIHSDVLKEEFEASGNPYIFDHLVEREFGAKINEVDRSIKVRHNRASQFIFSYRHILDFDNYVARSGKG